MLTENSSAQGNSPGFRRNLIAFLIALGVLALLRLAVGLLALPEAMVPWASVFVSIIFVGLPILALFKAADYPWTSKSATLMVLFGVAVQVGGAMAATRVGVPLLGGALIALSQSGLICWCFGVGALLTSLLKDKNLLVPVSIFLAIFDIWLVFVPEGPVNQILRTNPQIPASVSLQVPNVASQSAGGFARAMAYVGPADLLFLAMFFVALFKFNMRTTQTLRAMIPVLVAYLLVVLLIGHVEIGPIRLGALPALLPIGLVILLVNWREFKMTRDEAIATVLVAVISTGLLLWRMAEARNQPVEQVEPSQSAPAPEDAEPPGSQQPTFRV